MLDVPLDFSVDVKVKLLGHRQREQRRPLRVWFVTADKKTHVTSIQRRKRKNKLHKTSGTTTSHLINPLVSPVLLDVIQQRCDGRTLSCGLFVQKTPRSVLAHHKLSIQTQTGVTAKLLLDLTSPGQTAHLQRFVEPAVSTVGEGSASVQDLSCFAAGVPVSQSWNRNKMLRK